MKHIFVQERKAMFHLAKKVIFVFNTIFKLDCIMQIIYCIIQRCLYSHVIFCSLISVSKKWSMLTFHYSYNWQKFRTCSKHRQDCKHPKNVQFDVYAKTAKTFDGILQKS